MLRRLSGTTLSADWQQWRRMCRRPTRCTRSRGSGVMLRSENMTIGSLFRPSTSSDALNVRPPVTWSCIEPRERPRSSQQQERRWFSVQSEYGMATDAATETSDDDGISEELSSVDPDPERPEDSGDDEDPHGSSSLPSTNKKKRSPRSKKRRRSNTKKNPQSAAHQSFFDSVAPHVAPHRLTQLLQRMKEKLETMLDEEQAFTYTTKVGLVKALLGTSSPQPRSVERAYLEDSLLSYLAENRTFHLSRKKKNQEFQKHVEIVRRAREVATQSLVYWSQTHRRNVKRSEKRYKASPRSSNTTEKEQKEQQEESKVPSPDRLSLVQGLYQAKSPEQLEDEAKELVRHLTRSLPKASVDNLMNLFSNSVEAYEQRAANKQKSEKSGLAEGAEEKHGDDDHHGDLRDNSTDTAVSLSLDDSGGAVQTELTSDEQIVSGDGSVVSTSSSSPSKSQNNKKKRRRPMTLLYSAVLRCTKLHMHSVATQLTSFFYAELESEHVTAADPRIVHSQKNWSKTRTEVFDLLTDVEEKVEEASKKLPSIGENEADDEPKVRTVPKKVKKEQIKPSVRVVLDASQLKDPAMLFVDLQPPPTNRMLFLENLPIDIEETELLDVYARCGPIESVNIFNLRPTLDPGELSKKDLKQRSKAARRTMAGRRKRPWQPPRSPVYGTVRFATEKGYETATMPQLSIFGMVIRRHPVRSLPAERMHCLFLEEIPPGTHAVDLERRLNRILHPDVHFSLEMGKQDHLEPTVAELKLPSFEVAYYVHHKLSDAESAESINGIQLHWMQTPEDALQYWKREIGFDVEL